MKNTFLDFPERIASIVFTGGCNFRCPYCHNSEIIDNSETDIVSEETVLEYLDKRKKMIDGLVISGGEPTLQKDLPQFIDRVRDIGMQVKLDTNGSNPDLIRKLLEDKKLDYIALDYKAPIEKYHVVHPVPSFDVEELRESAKIIMDLAPEYEFRTTICRELLSKEDIIEIAEEISGCKTYYLQNFINSDNVMDRSLTSYSKEELNSILLACKKIIPNTLLR